MSTIAKGEITLSPVNDAYTVSITPASCVVRADFDGSNPQLDNAKGIITVKRGTREVPFKIDHTTHTMGMVIECNFNKATSIPFQISALSSNLLEAKVQFHIVTEDGFQYETDVTFNLSVVRESTMLDWIQDWEGSKTKIGGTYIMTPKLFVGKKEEVMSVVNGVPTWTPGALTGVYIGPDLLASGESSAGIYGYKSDKEIFHINADGGFIGGWTFNEGGLQSANGIVNILSEGTIFAQSPNSTTPYWGLYADGHAIFANGNVEMKADGSATFQGKIIAASGTIGGWDISQNQLHSGRIIIDSNAGYIGINASKLQILNAVTGDYVFPDKPEGGIKMWYSSAAGFGLAAWASSQCVFQLGSVNMIAGWQFNHQAIWTGSSTPYLSQGGYATEEGALTMAPNGIRCNKWYIDANGTASFVGGSVKFNAENAEMFGWLMRSGRFSSQHAALVSNSYYSGVYISVADISEVSSSSLVNTINNNGGIYMYSDGTNSIMRGYDKQGHVQFFLSTSGYNTIASWSFNHNTIYRGSDQISPEGYAMTSGSMVIGTVGIIGYLWKFNADGSGAVAGGNISWDVNGNVTFANSVKMAWSQITGTDGVMTEATYIDANGIFTGKISADNITAGSISTADIICDGKWALMRDGTGYLASRNIFWGADGALTVKGHVEANSGVIGGFKITDSGIFSLETNYYTGEVRNGAFSMFSQGSSAFLCFHDDGRWAGIGLNCTPAGGTPTVARFENNYSDTTFGWQTNIALYLSAQNGAHNFAFIGKGNGILNGFIAGSKLSLFTLSQADTIYSGYVKPSENNRWIIKATADRAGFQLPERYEVAQALGLNISTPWAVEFIIIGDIDSKSFNVYGKYLKVIGTSPNQSMPWCHPNDPLLVNANGARIDSVSLGAGDSLRILLVNNPNETKKDADSKVTVNGQTTTVEWSYQYTARILNYAT